MTPTLTAKSSQNAGTVQPVNIGGWWVSGIFMLSLTLTLWFNFVAMHVNCFSACDASEYLRYTQALWNLKDQPLSFWQHTAACLLPGTTPDLFPDVKSAFAPLQVFSISGPTFPAFLLACFAASGIPFEMSNWMVPLAVQSVLSACTAVLIALTARDAWNRQTGILSGLTAAIYPAFIINSGRLYAESFACFLLSAIAWLLVRTITSSASASHTGDQQSNSGSKPAIWPFFLIGFLLASLQLTRSAMFLLSIAVFGLVAFVWSGKQRWHFLSTICLGFALVMIPWLAWQKVAFGTSSLIVDRVGHYNFFIGNNSRTLGWLSFPYPDGAGIESRSLPRLAAESYAADPRQFLYLTQDKLPRLFKFPWNDFRISIGPFGQAAQVLFHQLIMLLSVTGIVIGTSVSSGRAPGRSRLLCRLALLGILAFHLVYLAFITIPRYNLTAMPFAIMFATAGACELVGLAKQRRAISYLVLPAFMFAVAQMNAPMFSQMFGDPFSIWISLACTGAVKIAVFAWLVALLWKLTSIMQGSVTGARAILAAMTIMLFPSVCLPVRAHGRLYEFDIPLKRPQEKIVQVIDLSSINARYLRASQPYLMIDCDGGQPLMSSTDIWINKVKLAAPVMASLPLLQNLTIGKSFAPGEISPEFEFIMRCMCGPAGLSNTDLRQWFLLPLPADAIERALQDKKLVVELERSGQASPRFFGGYVTDPARINIPSLTACSWEKAFYGVENCQGLTDSRYDTRLPALSNRRLSGNERTDLFVRLLIPHTPPGSTRLQALTKPLLPKSGSDSSVQVIEVSSPPKYASKDVWLIRLRGQVKSSAAQGVFFKAYSNDGTNTWQYNSPWTPGVIRSSDSWTKFDFAIPLAPSLLPGRLEKLRASFGQAPSWRRGGAARPSTPVAFRDVSMELLLLPSNPIAPGHLIY